MAVIEVKIPTLGESVSEGVIARWLKQEGEFVAADETLIELETDKAVMEIPAESAGTLSIVAAEGETVQVDQVIAKIDTEGQNGVSRQPAATSLASDSAEKSSAGSEPKTQAPSPEAQLSPAVRKLVAENELDPAQLSGTGKGGRLTKADVVQYLEQQKTPVKSAEPKSDAPTPQPRPAAPGAGTQTQTSEVRREPMSKIRQRIAERLVQAQQTAAILTTFNDVDMSAIMALRQKHKEAFEAKHGVKLGFMSLFGRAVVQALQDVPQLNAQIDGTDMVYFNHVHLGVAVSTQRGLMVPVIKYADKMTLAELERAIGAMAARGRDGKILPDELSGGTFSITNGGVFGSMLSTPLLNPPQSGILGMHRIEERPVAVNGIVEIRPMMYVAVSYDHRLVDGKEAVTFLVRVKQSLEDPERMLLDV